MTDDPPGFAVTDDADADSPEQVLVSESQSEYTEKRRLKAIFNAREEAAKRIRDASLREIEWRDGNSDVAARRGVNQTVVSAVRGYVFEVAPLYKNTDPGRSRWESHDLPAFRLPPNPPELEGVQDVASTSVDSRHLSDSDPLRVELGGVKDYLQLRPPVTISYEVEQELAKRGRSSTTTTIAVERSVPRSVSESVFRLTGDLLADLGIGLEAAVEDVDEWEI